MQVSVVIFTTVLGVAASSATAPLRVIRSTHAALERSIMKRQAAGGRGTAAVSAMECMNRCQPLLMAMSDIEGVASGGDAMSTGLEAFINEDREFNPDDLPTMCGKFKEAKACFDECEPHPMIEMVTGAFRPLEYMCIEKYDEFVKYQQCMHESAKNEFDECKDTCGDENEILQMMEGFQDMEGTRDFTQIINGLKDVCAFTDCHLTCATPRIDEHCGSEEPVQLMRNLMGESMVMMNQMFTQFGIGDSMPQECVNIGDMKPIDEATTPADSASVESASSEEIDNNSVNEAATTSERSNDTKDKTTKAPETQARVEQGGNAAPTLTVGVVLLSLVIFL